MGFVEEFLGDQGDRMVSQLTKQVGFAPDQAQRFVPEAVSQVVATVKGGEVDLSSLLGGGDLGDLISKLDLPGLASASGVDQATADRGLQSLLPRLLSALGDKAGGVGGILALLGGEGRGGLGDIGKLAGSLFKK